MEKRIITLMVGIGVFVLVACTKEPQDKDHLTIGLVSNNPNGLLNIQGFQDGMKALGYLEGENVTYVFEGAPIPGDRLDAVFENLVKANVDLIFTAGTPTGVAAHRITNDTDIPVIFGVIADPVAAGVMTDLTKPGGNMTGVKLSDNQARRLELLIEMAPATTQVLIPYDPDDPASSSAVTQVNAVASGLGVKILEGTARNDAEVTELLQAIPETIDAIFLVPGTTVNRRLQDVLTVAFERKLPVSAPSLIQVEEGALTTYGIIHHKVGEQAARIADQVLKGADPGSLPVETAEFFLALNLKTAEAIGLEIPYEIVQQAEIIIRDEQPEE